MKKIILFAALLACLPVFSAEISSEKKQEIEKMLRLTGMENLMNQMKTQMVASLKMQIPQVPEEFWNRFMQKLDTRELLDKIIPVYDKYYTLEDIKAINGFYSSPAGKKVLASLPQVTQECMRIGQEWGQKIGAQAAREIEQEQQKTPR